MVLSHPASGLSPLTSFGKKEEKIRFPKREKPPTLRIETSAHILFLVAKREPSLAGSVWYEGKHTSRRHVNTRVLTRSSTAPCTLHGVQLEPKHTFFCTLQCSKELSILAKAPPFFITHRLLFPRNKRVCLTNELWQVF